MSPTTLKFKNAELTTNDPALLHYLKTGRWALLTFGLCAFSLGACMSIKTPLLAVLLIVGNIALMAVNARNLFGIWFKTITHLLSSLENGTIKSLKVE